MKTFNDYPCFHCGKLIKSENTYSKYDEWLCHECKELIINSYLMQMKLMQRRYK